MDKNNITHLNYSIPTNNSKLVRSATVYGCDVYYMYFDCETGFIFWIGLYPGWW